MTMYLVLQFREGEPEGKFEVGGIFDSLQLAVYACRNWSYGIMPFELNQPAPDESCPGITWFPCTEERPEWCPESVVIH